MSPKTLSSLVVFFASLQMLFSQINAKVSFWQKLNPTIQNYKIATGNDIRLTSELRAETLFAVNENGIMLVYNRSHKGAFISSDFGRSWKYLQYLHEHTSGAIKEVYSADYFSAIGDQFIGESKASFYLISKDAITWKKYSKEELLNSPIFQIKPGGLGSRFYALPGGKWQDFDQSQDKKTIIYNADGSVQIHQELILTRFDEASNRFNVVMQGNTPPSQLAPISTIYKGCFNHYYSNDIHGKGGILYTSSDGKTWFPYQALSINRLHSNDKQDKGNIVAIESFCNCVAFTNVADIDQEKIKAYPGYFNQSSFNYLFITSDGQNWNNTGLIASASLVRYNPKNKKFYALNREGIFESTQTFECNRAPSQSHQECIYPMFDQDDPKSIYSVDGITIVGSERFAALVGVALKAIKENSPDFYDNFINKGGNAQGGFKLKGIKIDCKAGYNTIDKDLYINLFIPSQNHFDFLLKNPVLFGATILHEAKHLHQAAAYMASFNTGFSEFLYHYGKDLNTVQGFEREAIKVQLSYIDKMIKVHQSLGKSTTLLSDAYRSSYEKFTGNYPDVNGDGKWDTLDSKQIVDHILSQMAAFEKKK